MANRTMKHPGPFQSLGTHNSVPPLAKTIINVKKKGLKENNKMATRGTVLKQDIGAAKRMTAPAHLSDSEKAVWSEVVNDQPASAFTATHTPLLEMYCRHVVNGRVMADELKSFDRAWLTDDDGLRRYDMLLKIAERESRAASSLATRLRITRQAVDHPTTAGRAISNNSKFRKPWDTENIFANNGKRPNSE